MATTSYTKYKIYLSKGQKDKLINCIKKNEDCTLRIQPKNGNTDLMLTVTQINQIQQAKRENKVVDIHLSKTQLQKSGGFLPLLAAAIPAVLPFIARAAATGAIGYAGNKIAQKIMGKGIRLPGKKGSGIYLQGKDPRRRN